MVIHSPFTYFGDPFTPYGTPQSVQEMIGRVQATLEPVLVVAESAETILVIETIFDRNPQPLVEVIRSFDSPYVKLSIDTGHCYITHRLGGASPDAWIDAAGDLVHHLHIQDTDGLADRHWAPGVGAINWVALFQALNKLESNPRMILELRDKASIMGVCGWLSEKGLAR